MPGRRLSGGLRHRVGVVRQIPAGHAQHDVAVVGRVERVVDLQAALRRDLDRVRGNRRVGDQAPSADVQPLLQVYVRVYHQVRIREVECEIVHFADSIIVVARSTRLVPADPLDAAAAGEDSIVLSAVALVIQHDIGVRRRRVNESVAHTHAGDKFNGRVCVSQAAVEHVDAGDASLAVYARHGAGAAAGRVGDDHLRRNDVAGAGAGNGDALDLAAEGAYLDLAGGRRRFGVHAVVDRDAVSGHAGQVVGNDVVDVRALSAANHQASGAVGVASGRVGDVERVAGGRAADLCDRGKAERGPVAVAGGDDAAVGFEIGGNGGAGVGEIEQVGGRQRVEQQRVQSELPVEPHHVGAAGGAAGNRVVARAADDGGRARARSDEVVSVVALDPKQSCSAYEDGVAAQPAPQDAQLVLVAAADEQNVVALAALEEHRQAIQAAGVDGVVAGAADEHDTRHAGERLRLRDAEVAVPHVHRGGARRVVPDIKELRAVGGIERILVRDALGGAGAGVDYQRAVVLRAFLVDGVGLAGKSRRAVVALTREAEQRHLREGVPAAVQRDGVRLPRRPDAQAHPVVVPGIDLAAEVQVGQVDRIARV